MKFSQSNKLFFFLHAYMSIFFPVDPELANLDFQDAQVMYGQPAQWDPAPDSAADPVTPATGRCPHCPTGAVPSSGIDRFT